VAIGAYKNTLIANAKRFIAIDMMEVKSAWIFIVSAYLALPAFIFYGQEFNLAPPFGNSFD